MNGTVAVLAGLVAILATMGAGLRYLAVISVRMGALLERLDGHIRVSDERDADHEARIRGLESGIRAGRGGRRESPRGGR